VAVDGAMRFEGDYLEGYELSEERTPSQALLHTWFAGNIVASRESATLAEVDRSLTMPGMLDSNLARGPPTGRKILVTDQLSSTLGETDSVGGVVGEHRYTLYGEVREGDAADGVGFHGARFQGEAGVYYLRNRWYDPGLGRFISRDPIGLSGGSNPYGFVEGAPLTLSDPSGLRPQPIVGDPADYNPQSDPGAHPAYYPYPNHDRWNALKDAGVIAKVSLGPPLFVYGGGKLFAAGFVAGGPLGGLAALGAGGTVFYAVDRFAISPFVEFSHHTVSTLFQEYGGLSAHESERRATAIQSGANAIVLPAMTALAFKFEFSCPRFPAPSTAPIRSGEVVQVVELAGETVQLAARHGDELIEVMAAFRKDFGTLYLERAHIEGSSAGRVGIRQLFEFARDLGRANGVLRVVIKGGRRTTGKNVGSVPRPLKIKIN